MKRFLPEASIQEEITLLQKLFFLSARDHVYLCRPFDECTLLGEVGYYTLEKHDLMPSHIDLMMKLYDHFGQDGLEAWAHLEEPWLHRKKTESFLAATEYIKDPSIGLPEKHKSAYAPKTVFKEGRLIVSSYPEFIRAWPEMSPEQELDVLQKIAELAADDVIFFSTFDEEESIAHGKNLWTIDAKPVLVMNDSFCYASADAERFEMEDLDLLVELNEKFGWHGVLAWAAQERGQTPLKPHLVKKYCDAQAFLATKKEIDHG